MDYVSYLPQPTTKVFLDEQTTSADATTDANVYQVQTAPQCTGPDSTASGIKGSSSSGVYQRPQSGVTSHAQDGMQVGFTPSNVSDVSNVSSKD